MAERAVQTVKTLLKKVEADNRDPYIALMQYRNTPWPDSPSPAQLLMNRRIRTTLPATDAYLKPNIPNSKTIPATINKCQVRQKKTYDKTALMSTRSPLQPGASVRMQTKPGGAWKPATIISEAGAPRSYIVRTADGTTSRRNRNMLRETKETFVLPDDAEVEDQAGSAREPPVEEEEAAHLPAAPRQAPLPYITWYGRQVLPPAQYPDPR